MQNQKAVSVSMKMTIRNKNDEENYDHFESNEVDEEGNDDDDESNPISNLRSQHY